MAGDFSYRTRQDAIKRFRASSPSSAANPQPFDVMIIGGGITGAATARDAASRGLKVALVERYDFAYGTSSRSSKLIHGGLRYLQNMEFKLVFEALSERAYLLKTAPQMVRPLPFYLPFYKGDPHSSFILGMGLWAYDVLALFRTPEFHKRLSRKKMLAAMPFLKADGLRGGFRYFDASMKDDILDVQVLQSAASHGAVLANYCEAMRPIWDGNRVAGFVIRDNLNPANGEFEIHAHRTVVAAGPWTDDVGTRLSNHWSKWLQPSKGVHLIFDLKKIPVPGALVMSHPEDGRIAFVIPRPDMGQGVVIVGTTDGPPPKQADEAAIEPEDVHYLLDLLSKYFPELKLTAADILSGYVGVRPLMAGAIDASSQGIRTDLSGVLQKVSREHHIDRGPGGTVVVAGGKYTTHRTMAEEIVDFVIASWYRDLRGGTNIPSVPRVGKTKTAEPINARGTPQATAAAQVEANQRGLRVPNELWDRYGADALEIAAMERKHLQDDPEGFPLLESQLRFALRHEMAVRLEDFYLRRSSLFLARADHGLPWGEALSKVWAEERGASAADAAAELGRLEAEIHRRAEWKKRV